MTMDIFFKKRDINVFKLINIDNIKKDCFLDGLEFSNYCISSKNTLLITFTNRILPLLGTRVKIVEITINWTTLKVEKKEIFNLCTIPLDSVDFVDRIGDDFLLVCSRCFFDEEPSIKNAVIAKNDGKLVRRFCIGDAIQGCVVRNNLSIVVSYFDEGIYGEYDYNGLALFSHTGELVWKNSECPIDDCYAIFLDECDELWFYYYSDFKLAHTSFDAVSEYSSEIKGSSAFAVFPSKTKFLFRGGYGNEQSFYIASLNGLNIKKQYKIRFTYKTKRINVVNCNFTRPKLLFLANDNNIYTLPLK